MSTPTPTRGPDGDGDADAGADAGRGCPACGYREAAVGEVDPTRTALAAVCDVAGHRFDRIACLNCGYAELHRDRSPRDLLDLFME